MFSQGRTQMSFILLAEFPMLKKKKCIHIWFNFARHYTHPSETMPFIEIFLVVGKCHPHLGRASAVLEPASQWRPRLEVTQLPRSVLLSAPRMADPTRLLSTIDFFLTQLGLLTSPEEMFWLSPASLCTLERPTWFCMQSLMLKEHVAKNELNFKHSGLLWVEVNLESA